jgi:hypothetical protein
MAFAAPAIPPASAISFNERLGNGDMIRFEKPYEAKRRELTPAIPISGLNMPSLIERCWRCNPKEKDRYLCIEQRTLLF